MALGLISRDFPTIGEASATQSEESRPPVGQEPVEGNVRDCDCPRRQRPPRPPTEMPFPATEEYRGQLEEWLKDRYKCSTFNTCEHQTLPMMDGPPLRLMVDEAAQPTACHKVIPVPIHWREQVKADLDRDVRLGVIEPVPVGEPVTWCHRMVITAKKNGKPRRTVDLQALNKHAKRETHHTSSPFQQARSVPSNTKKTICDAWNGYHSIPLHPEDRHLTTFLTPWGRYRYRVAPQGYIASGDGYTRRYDEVLASGNLSHNHFTKCVDDTLLWADTVEESFWQAIEWLELTGSSGIVLNPDKFVFAKDTVEFAGFQIDATSVKPCNRYVRAIREFPTPRSITDVRAWFGVINQVSYAFSMAEKMAPYRELLKPGTPFRWDEQLDALFAETKEVIINEIAHGVRIFDTNKPTCLATDWSKTGIGFWLFQKHCSCAGETPFCCKDGWKITLIGSRFTSPAESRYKPIEGEALAVAEALDKARFFVLGCGKLTVAVDHKPLLKILDGHSLEDIPNARLRNLKEKTLRYRFRVVYVPGVRNVAADWASRYPSGPAGPETMQLPDDVDATVDEPHPFTGLYTLLAGTRLPAEPDQPAQNVDVAPCDPVAHIQETTIGALDCTSVTWDRVKTETTSDAHMRQLVTLVEQGTMPPSRQDLPDELQPYHQFKADLQALDGVLLYKQRVVIPPKLRPAVLASLHSAHQGVQAMLSRAEDSIFWPGITPAIQATRAGCNACNRMAPSQPRAPPTPPVVPDYPFQCVCADYLHHRGAYYLVLVDRYSNWPIVEQGSGGSAGLIQTLRRVFVTYGIPDELTSDGGPEFAAGTTVAFLRDWGIHHRLASVAFPHSNCRAEVGVKTVKRMITGNTGPSGTIDTDKFGKAMLQYRNTPDPETKMSPASVLFGRPIRDFIPIYPGKYRPHPTWQETLTAREEALRNRHMKAAERWSEHTRRLPPLAVGDQVRIQNQVGPHPKRWDKTGRVIEVRQYDQYGIRVDGSGRVTLRNRQFLRRYIPAVSERPKPRLLTDDLLFLGRPTAPMAPGRHTEPITDNAEALPPPLNSGQAPPSPRADARRSPAQSAPSDPLPPLTKASCSTTPSASTPKTTAGSVPPTAGAESPRHTPGTESSPEASGAVSPPQAPKAESPLRPPAVEPRPATPVSSNLGPRRSSRTRRPPPHLQDYEV